MHPTSARAPGTRLVWVQGNAIEVGKVAGVFLQRDGRTVTLWNRDVAAMNTDTNLYVSHPFLLELRANGEAHGFFVANSNGMDVQLDADMVTFRYDFCIGRRSYRLCLASRHF